MTYTLDADQQKKFAAWQAEQDALLLAKPQTDEQKRYGPGYVGAIGGRHTWCYTPTGLGEILVIKDNATGNEINLTDFDSW